MTAPAQLAPSASQSIGDQAAALRRWARTGTAEAPVPRTSRAFTIALASGKGGVGKTTLAVNLSIALRRSRAAVTLLDADLGMANADVLCGLSPRRRLDQALNSPDLLPQELAIEAPGGFLLVPGCVGISRLVEPGHQEQSALFAMLQRLESQNDLLVIDTGAGIGAGVTSMLAAAAAPIVVVTPDPPSIADAYALIKCVLPMMLAEGRSPSDLSLLVNQARDHAEAVAVHARIAGVCARFLRHDLRMLGWVPTDPAVAESVRRRVPFLVGAERCAAGRSLHPIAQALLARAGWGPTASFPDHQPGGWLGRILGIGRASSA